MDKKRKAEIFADHFSEVFSPHNNDQDQEVEQDRLQQFNDKNALKHSFYKE
jgi:hypothetical protein